MKPQNTGILYFLALVHEFVGDFKDVPISPVVPDYAGILAFAKKAQNQLSFGRLSRDSAETQATEYMSTFRQLEGKIEILDASRDELNKIKIAQAKADRQFLIRITLAACTLVISLILLLKQ